MPTSLGLPLIAGDSADFRVPEDVNALAQAIDAYLQTQRASGKMIYDGSTTAANNSSTPWGNFTADPSTPAIGCTYTSTGIIVTYAGRYIVTAKNIWVSQTTGRRGVFITVNGAEPSHREIGNLPSGSGPLAPSASALLTLAAGDKVGAIQWQESGGALTVVAADIAISRPA